MAAGSASATRRRLRVTESNTVEELRCRRFLHAVSPTHATLFKLLSPIRDRAQRKVRESRFVRTQRGRKPCRGCPPRPCSACGLRDALRDTRRGTADPSQIARKRAQGGVSDVLIIVMEDETLTTGKSLQ